MGIREFLALVNNSYLDREICWVLLRSICFSIGLFFLILTATGFDFSGCCRTEGERTVLGTAVMFFH